MTSGVVLMPQPPRSDGPVRRFRRCVQQAVVARDAGFDAVAAGHHDLSPLRGERAGDLPGAVLGADRERRTVAENRQVTRGSAGPGPCAGDRRPAARRSGRPRVSEGVLAPGAAGGAERGSRVRATGAASPDS